MSRTLKILSLNVVICVCFLVTVNSQNSSRQRRDAEENEHHLLNILKIHEIIPDIIDDASHADTLEVVYVSDLSVNRGDEMTPTEVRDQPIRVTWNAEPTSYYTLILVDPDAPNRKRPKHRSFQHWIVGNIPGNNVAAGDVLTEYVGAIPSKNSGLHRYVFLLFEQLNGKREFHESFITNRDALRTKFSLREFMARYHLKEPIAVNFFLGKYDDTVPSLLQRFLNLQQEDEDNE